MKIILATTSPYRQEIFKYLGFPFESVGSMVDESQLERGNPEELVRQLSKMKAEAVAQSYPEAIVIGFDSVAYFNGKILEKPKSKQETSQRLKDLSGQKHQFYTGVYMINTATKQTLSRIAVTDVFMREFSDQEISKYLDEDSNFNTYALGYDPVKNYSASFIKRIEGSYYNLLAGIPLDVVVEMLEEMGHDNKNAQNI